mgnify:CR=1 FL=1
MTSPKNEGAVQKVKSPLKTKNHKHRYINVSKTLMGASISRKNDLLDTPFCIFCFFPESSCGCPVTFSILRDNETIPNSTCTLSSPRKGQGQQVP